MSQTERKQRSSKVKKRQTRHVVDERDDEPKSIRSQDSSFGLISTEVAKVLTLDTQTQVEILV